MMETTNPDAHQVCRVEDKQEGFLDPERWVRVKEILSRVEEAPPERRHALLAELCEGDETLADEVRDLLSYGEPTTGELGNPLWRTAMSIPEQKQTLSGTTLGPWRLIRELGVGGMGAVWLAERADQEFAMKAAVKLIRKEWTGLDLSDRFKRERQFLADLHHPNIAMLLDGGTGDDGAPYLVMEYVEGAVIDSWCRAQEADPVTVLSLVRQTALAVAYAHRKGILHLDIKPGNIMVTEDGHVKLMDFGIAESKEALEAAGGRSHAPMTPEYTAPERLKGSTSSASDIYALGVVLFQLMTGRRPTRDQQDFGKALRDFIDKQNRPDLDGVADLVGNMTASTPSMRPVSAERVMRRIDLLLQQMGSTSPLGGATVRYDAVVWVHPAHQATAERLVRRLEDETNLRLWLASFFTAPEEPMGEALAAALEEGLALMVLCVADDTPPWSDQDTRRQVAAALEAHPLPVTPVLTAGVARPHLESDLPPFLRDRSWVVLGEHLYHRELKALARALRQVTTTREQPEREETCPFKGLEAFGEADARFFHGRESFNQRLQLQMERGRFLAVLGPSGSGKSSVVLAGLVPHLRARGDGVAVMTPRARPLEELCYALQSLYPAAYRPGVNGLMDQVMRGLDFVGQIPRDIAKSGGPQRITLIVDQFEELFTLTASQAEVHAFLAVLMRALEETDQVFKVVLTLRSDFMGHVARFADLNAYVSEHMLQLPPMNRENLRTAMVKPAALAGLEFEAGLVEKILDDVRDDAGELPLLEHALLELYQRRVGRLLTAAAYTEIGGIEGALARRAEAEYQSGSRADQQLIRKMFTLALIHPGEGSEDTRRRADRQELVGLTDQPERAEAVLQKLIAVRLLTARRDDARGIDQVDVAHEALIRKWDRIGQWMEQDRRLARRLSRLRGQAKTWAEAGRDPDLLPRGGPLYQMLDLANQQGSYLGDLENAFIAAAKAEHEAELEREKAVAARLRRQKRNAQRAGALALLLAAFALWSAYQSNQARNQAEAAQRQVEAEVLETNYNLALMLGDQAVVAADQDSHPRPFLLGLAALSREIPEGRALPDALGLFANPQIQQADALLWTSPVASKSALADDGRIDGAVPPGHGDRVFAVAWSRDGRQMASASADHRVILWDRQTGAVVHVFNGHVDAVTDLAFSPDGKQLASSSNDGTVRLWRLDGSTDVDVLKHPEGVNAVAYAPAGDVLVTGSVDGIVRVWQGDGRQHQSLTGHNEAVNGVALSPDGQSVASASHDGTVRLWSLADEDADPTLFSGHRDGVWDVAFSPDGTRLASASGDRELRLWSLEEGTSITLKGHELSVVSTAFSPDGGLLASTSFDRTIRLWSTSDGSHVGTIYGHHKAVADAAFSPDGTNLLSAGHDHRVRLWSTQVQPIKARLSGHNQGVIAVAYSPDGKTLISGGVDRTIRLWSTATGTSETVLRGHESVVATLAVAPDGQRLASGSWDQTVRLWNLPDGSPGAVLRGHEGRVMSVAFSPDGATVASASRDGSIRLWNGQDGEAGAVMRGHEGPCVGVHFSPDGLTLASTSYDHSVRLWSTKDGSHVQTLEGHRDRTMGVVFSPDDSLLASSSFDQTIRLWNARTGEAGAVLSGHQDQIWSLAFAPDGTALASASSDQTLRIWDLEGRTLAVLRGHGDAVFGVAFSPDSAMLASASNDGSLRQWDFSRMFAVKDAFKDHGRGLDFTEAALTHFGFALEGPALVVQPDASPASRKAAPRSAEQDLIAHLLNQKPR